MSTTGVLTSNGDTDVYTVVAVQRDPNDSNWLHFHASGNFGGGTVQVYFEIQDTWLPLTDATYTAATDDKLELKIGTKVKATLSGATSPNLNWGFI